ncbi:MAG: MarR family transcriptional regulator [Aeromicrobium sp.]
MTNDLPADLDVYFEASRFVVKARARTLSQLKEIHPELDYGTFLFFLAICDAPDGIRGSSLAGLFGVHKSTASRAAANLDSMGLIRRATDPQDGRAQRLIATSKGAKVVEALRVEGREWLASLLSDWSADELSQFAANLARVNAAWDKVE